jgi:hypothetical protein
MTVIENLDAPSDRWEALMELDAFEKIRPRHDGHMPVGSYRARNTACRRANRYRRPTGPSLAASRR